MYNTFSHSACLTGLSHELEELMVEGLLLQVHLPQVQTLYQVLLDRASSQHTNTLTSPPQEELTDCDKHMQFISQGTNIPLNQVRSHVTKKKPKASKLLQCHFYFEIFYFFRMVPTAQGKPFLAQKEKQRGIWRGKVQMQSAGGRTERTLTRDRR